MNLIVIESLNKFYEFGTDRVSGGVIWTSAKIDNEIDIVRIHCGTIIPDTSLASLPIPNRARLDTRLARVERNAHFIATKLHEHLTTHHTSKISSVIYPGLPTYHGYEWTKNMSFRGPFITLSFKGRFRKTAHYNRFIRRAITAAQERGVALDRGTSFGFDTTRISIAAFYSEESRRYIRIAVGTETISEIETLAEALIEALN